MIPIREFRSLVGLDDVYFENDVRLLDEEIEMVDGDDNVTMTTTNSTAPIDGNDAAVLRNTMVVYGGLFCILFVLFCMLRQRYPKIYNIRNWVPELKTTLAEDTRGTFSWLWKVFLVSDSEMLDECGMDALCFARVLEFGLKLSILGMLMAIWLIPVYATANTTPETAYIEDRIVSISVSHVPSGSYRFCATVVACYCVFGFTMYNILQEFTWFISYRHQYLAKRRPRNYAVYIQCIPPEYRTKAKLMHFLQQSHVKNSILDVHLAVKVPNLKKRVAERDAVITKLEHAITVQQVSGVTPMQRNGGGLPIPSGLPFVPGGGGGAAVSLIDALFEELRALNTEIGGTIEKIEKEQEEELMALTSTVRTTPRHRNYHHHHEQDPLLRHRELRGIHETQSFDGTITTTFSESNHNNVTFSASTNGGMGGLGTENGDERSNGNSTGTDNNSLMGSIKSAASKTTQGLAGVAKVSTKGIVDVAKVSTKGIVDVAKISTNGVKTIAAGAISLVQGDEDGTPMNAAFVTFKSLRATQATLQMIQYPEPFAMEVLEAPDPDDVFWQNVGKTHKELQLGKLLSFGLTATLCLLWTIPMATISTLSNIEGLRAEVKFVDKMLTAQPWMVPIFAQLAPLLIVAAREMLKIILEYLSMLEGPVSGAVVQSSLFAKQAAFMIIQTFFVSSIAGGVVSAISDMIEQPTMIVDLLATSLPTQSTFFIQILMVDTFLSLAMELLRVSAVAIAAVRRYVGPNLSEKERNTTWMGLRPLADPLEFEHADLLSGAVLYFMVFFVYSTLAPICTFFLALCFLLLCAGYRHQFIYIYPTIPDSGGALWVNFMKIIPTCMLIAQVTILGMLALKKAATASAMMFPLFVITILFSAYIRQKHFAMAENLPARDCLTTDMKYTDEEGNPDEDFEFLRNEYVQPELRDKQLMPENATSDQEIALEVDQFATPPGSEAEMVETNPELGI